MKNKSLFKLLVCVVIAYGSVSTRILAELSLEDAVLNNAKEVEEVKVAEETKLAEVKVAEETKLAEAKIAEETQLAEEKVAEETKAAEETKLAEEKVVEVVEDKPKVEAKDSETEQMMTQEEIFRNSLEHQVSDLTQESLNLRNKEEFENALLPLQKALKLLTESKVGNANDKLVITNEITDVYVVWAEYLNLKGYDLQDLSLFKEALSKANKALDTKPSLKKWHKTFVENCKYRQGIVEYKKNTSESVVDKNKITREYEENLNNLRGRILFKDNKYVLARREYEKTLVINPYNAKAIEGVRQCNLKLRKYGRDRKNITIMERITEEQWKHIQPIRSKVQGVEVGVKTDVVAKNSTSSSMKAKLDNIVFKNIEFADVPIDLVVKFIRQRSKVLDPLKVGVNIFLKVTSEEMPKVTMIVSNVTLREAIRNICVAASSLKFRIEKHAIIIASNDVPLDDVETRIYPLEQDALSGIEGTEPEQLKEYFKKRGINFPANAAIVYDDTISRLIVTNTPAALDMVEAVVREINVIDPQVLIETKFIEVAQNDLEELGFQYYWENYGKNSGLSAPKITRDDFLLGGPKYQEPTFVQAVTTSTVSNVKVDGLGDVTGTADGGVSRNDNILNITHTGSGNASAMISALNQMDSTDTLSTPRITTMNGQTAEIRMIREVYFPDDYSDFTATSENFIGSTPQFADPTSLGINLEVTPTVEADNYTILLDMEPKIREFGGWDNYSMKTSSFDAAGDRVLTNTNMVYIDERSVQTSVSLYDGETVILGGIIKDVTSSFDDQYPILGDLPLVGRLFQSKASRSVKTNLLIFLTCSLLHPDGSPVRGANLRGLPEFRN